MYKTSIILLLFFFRGNTQENTMLKGRITTETSTVGLINIINKTKGIGTTNQESGYFEIQADVGGTVKFSSVQFEILEHIVAQNDLRSDILL